MPQSTQQRIQLPPGPGPTAGGGGGGGGSFPPLGAYQEFSLLFNGSAQTCEFAENSRGVGAVIGAFASKITNQTLTARAVPQVANGVGFGAAGVGIDSSDTHSLILNSGPQSNTLFHAIVERNTSTVALVVAAVHYSRNINGVTQDRIALRFEDNSGTVVDLTAMTGFVWLRITGYIE